MGAHTAYIRNDNTTRILVGDIYQGQISVASVDLKVGPVGIVVPLRGVAQSAFSCRFTPVDKALQVIGPLQVPDLLELAPVSAAMAAAAVSAGKPQGVVGLLLSSIFSIVIHNMQSHPLSIDIQLEQPRGISTRCVYVVEFEYVC